jgi:SOS-response transcriptional repressor LexA
MPHALTDRQREYLEFIRQYVADNESAPRLEEIAEHFGVTPPTAHNMLETLQTKGYLYFGRSKVSGFFIRLIERAGSAETVVEIPVTGKIDAFGELFDFPTRMGHFATVLLAANPGDLFALFVTDEIQSAAMLPNDFLIFDMGKSPQPGDICIGPIGDRLFLIRIDSKTFDKHTPQLEMAQGYPIPEPLTDPSLGQQLHWYPLAYDDETEAFFLQVAEEEAVPIGPLPPDWIVATALRLTRPLAF